MAKYYRRRFYYKKRKYNIENRTLSFKTPTTLENGFAQNQIQIVPPSVTEGVRQATRFTITLTNKADGDYQMHSIFWALVYIPEGAVTSALFPGDGTSLFQPSNYVLASGVNDPNGGPIRISTRIKKNLNANDQIYLLTATQATAADFVGLVRYAICYN